MPIGTIPHLPYFSYVTDRFCFSFLSLHSAAGVAVCKGFHLGKGYHIVIAFDRMFQATCRNGKFDRLLSVVAV